MVKETVETQDPAEREVPQEQEVHEVHRVQQDLRVYQADRLELDEFTVEITWKHRISRCPTGGESEDHTGEKACKGSTLALKPGTDVTRSPKQGY